MQPQGTGDKSQQSGPLCLLVVLLTWVSDPAGAAALDTDISSDAGNWTESGNEIQNYNTQTAPLFCQLSTCELLLKELGAMQENMRCMQEKMRASESKVVAMEARLETSESSTRELVSLKSKLMATEEKTGIMEAELQAHKNEIEELKEENRVNVAFSAALGYHGQTGPYNVDKTLVYKNIITNISNAYNSATGIFTAPVRGTYFFSFYYHASTYNKGCLMLKKNGQILATASHHKVNSGTDNGSNGVTVQMEVGEQVYVSHIRLVVIWESVFN